MSLPEVPMSGTVHWYALTVWYSNRPDGKFG